MGTINTSLYLQNIGVQGFLTQEQLAGLSIAIQTDTTSGGYTGKFYDKYGNVVTVIKGLVMSVLPQSIKLTVNEQFDYFTFTGSDIFVDWGDGSTSVITGGTNIPATHTYATAGTYNISIWRDTTKSAPNITAFYIDSMNIMNNADYLISVDALTDTITDIAIQGNNNLIACDFSGLYGCENIDFRNNHIFNDTLDLSALGNCTSLNIVDNILFDKPLDFTFMKLLENLSVDQNNILNSAIDLSGLTLLSYFSFVDNLIYNQSINIAGLLSLIFINMSNGSLTTLDINAILAACVSNGYTSTTIVLNGQTPPAPPSGQGITDKAALILAGCSVTTD